MHRACKRPATLAIAMQQNLLNIVTTSFDMNAATALEPMKKRARAAVQDLSAQVLDDEKTILELQQRRDKHDHDIFVLENNLFRCKKARSIVDAGLLQCQMAMQSKRAMIDDIVGSSDFEGERPEESDASECDSGQIVGNKDSGASGSETESETGNTSNKNHSSTPIQHESDSSDGDTAKNISGDSDNESDNTLQSCVDPTQQGKDGVIRRSGRSRKTNSRLADIP